MDCGWKSKSKRRQSCINRVEGHLFANSMINRISCSLVYLLMLIPLCLTAQSRETIVVGAKHFNEGYILGEMIALVLEDAGYPVDRKFNLGGTAVIFEGLKNKAVDVYPEYTEIGRASCRE